MRWNNLILGWLAHLCFAYTFYGQTELDCETLWKYYQQDNKDTTVLAKDKMAFCQGVEAARASETLVLKKNVNSFEVDACTRYAYEKYGVKLECTGESKLNSVISKNAGFNFVMHQRLRKKLGKKYRLLGKVNPDYIAPNHIIDRAFVQTFNEQIRLSENWLGKVKLKFRSKVKYPQYLNDLIITDRDSGKEFAFQDFYHGVCLKITEKTETKQNKTLSFWISKLEGEQFCQVEGLPDISSVKVDMKNYLEKWED